MWEDPCAWIMNILRNFYRNNRRFHPWRKDWCKSCYKPCSLERFTAGDILAYKEEVFGAMVGGGEENRYMEGHN